jgi:hypothetical protein
VKRRSRLLNAVTAEVDSWLHRAAVLVRKRHYIVPKGWSVAGGLQRSERTEVGARLRRMWHDSTTAQKAPHFKRNQLLHSDRNPQIGFAKRNSRCLQKGCLRRYD